MGFQAWMQNRGGRMPVCPDCARHGLVLCANCLRWTCMAHQGHQCEKYALDQAPVP